MGIANRKAGMKSPGHINEDSLSAQELAEASSQGTTGTRRHTSAFAIELARQLVSTLPHGLPGLFNPWFDNCPDDEPHNGPERKLARLAAHLDCAPELILVGEAAGYKGCRHTGIAFSSEAQLCETGLPRLPVEPRLTRRHIPYRESSATVVWGALEDLHLSETTILWNALPLHPHRVTDRNSNSTPRKAEMDLGAPAMHILAQAFPTVPIVAIGGKAEKLLKTMKVPTFASVRHPAKGGTTEFRAGMRNLAKSLPNLRSKKVDPAQHPESALSHIL